MTKALEFEAELTGSRILNMPPEIADALPSEGKVTVMVFVNTDPNDATWLKAAYEQFLRDDPEEDAVYDKYR
jgi:hypothetical protein